MSTAGARVRCPHCGKAFKIPDRSLLGRTGKCSACAQRFTLTEDEAGPAAADAPAKSTPAAASPKPAPKSSSSDATEKTSPVPSAPTSAAAPLKPAVAKPPKSAAPNSNSAATTAKPTPPAVTPAPKPVAPPTKEPLKRPAAPVPEVIPVGLNARWVSDDVPFAPTAAATDPDNPFSDTVDFNTPSPAPAAQTRRVASTSTKETPRQRTKKSKTPMYIAAAIALVLVGGAAAFQMWPASTNSSGQSPSIAVSTTPPSINPATVPVTPAAYSRDQLKGNIALVEEFRPTHGRPISMQYVPNGVNLVVHLRPAELWGSDHAAAELRASLTEGVTSWLEARIKQNCRREPAKVSEATFAFVLGAFGTQPACAEVVHLVEPTKMSTLLDEFGGKSLKDDLKPPVNVADPFAYVIVDANTIAIAPSDTAEELVDALTAPNSYVSKNVAELLKQTDRDRLLTVVAEIPDLRRHIDTLFAEPVRPTIKAILDWLGDDVDAIAWSLHNKPSLHSEITIRPRTGVAPRALEATIQKKLDDLPAKIMALVKSTRPAQKGFRELIGRYPAMLEAVRESTVLRPGPRDLYSVTVLPAKAAPNLALGTLLTWDESRRSGGTAASATASLQSTGAEKVADRLKKEILAEMSRLPLEQAVKYIGEEVGVPFSVDGEALRLTGYTRNMPQTMSLGKVPATRALKEILAVPNQKDLAVYVDEAAGTAVMSTKPMLKQQGRTEFKIE